MEEKLLPLLDRNYVKSNILIGAKYKSSLLENKIMAVAFSRIQNAQIDRDGIICKITAKELMNMMGIKRGSFYEDLDTCAQAMTGRTVGMSDPEKKMFHYMAVITSATYMDGILTIKFNSDLKYYITNIKENFTRLNLNTMISFSSVYSFRMYELLKSRAYYPKGKEKEDKKFIIQYTVSELKLSLGIVNAELDSVRRVLNNTNAPDYDKAIEKSPEKTFERWSDFKKRVLDTAVNEINEKTEIQVDYTLHKRGKGGRVQAITFVVTQPDIVTEKKPEPKEITQELKEECYEYISELFKDNPLTYKNMKVLAELAQYDCDKISGAFEVMTLQPEPVRDVMGFMCAAIKEEYEINSAQEQRAREKFLEAKQQLIEDGYTKDYQQMTFF